ncbi:MAG: N-acetylmuramidase domain-containing protein [Rhizobiaceae bacterium]
MFDDETEQAITERALKLDLEPSLLLAVTEVESAGKLFADIDNRNEPLIRFEGHYFDRQLKGEQRQKARTAGLASPKAGAVRNSRSQSQRWRMLKRAMVINRTAALSSTSWGVGQVMGIHWNWLNFGSVDALVSTARSGAVGQVDLMVRFIERSNLIPVLQNHDWTGFARRYNGPGFARNQYDRKLQLVYHRISKTRSDKWRKGGAQSSRLDGKSLYLRIGSVGDEVSDVQARLKAHGYPIKVDGIFGIETDRALRQFQRASGDPETGIARGRIMVPSRGAKRIMLLGLADRSKLSAKDTDFKWPLAAGTSKSKISQSARIVGSWLLSIFRRIA